MKRFLLLAFAAVLTLTVMTGCTNKDNEAGSEVDNAITTISEGLDDMTGNDTTSNTENRTDTGESNARTRRSTNHR